MNMKDSNIERIGSRGNFAKRINTLADTFGGVSSVARSCGLSEGVVRSWRDGRSDPSRTRCIALAKGLGVSLLWVVAGEGAMLGNADVDEPHTLSAASSERKAAGNGKMDPQRLSAALQVLESALKLAGTELSLSDNPDLLADYYELLGHTDPIKRARMAAKLNERLLERVQAKRIA
jgi:hypothetical protein